MIDYKRCSGWWGVWACVVDYPSHMVPESEFHKHGDDGLQGMCKACMSMRNVENHKVSNKETNAVSKEVYLLAGGSRAFYEKPKEERMGLRLVARKNHLPDTAPEQEVLEFLFPETKESVITQRTINQKSRNHTMYTMLKELYNYTCQVEGCNETEVELAHIYKHSLPDSVDNETNAWCLCCNHHRAYDANRMELMPYPMSTHALRFIRYNRFGKVVEISRIIYDEKHTVNIKWIKKAGEYRDREKQALG